MANQFPLTSYTDNFLTAFSEIIRIPNGSASSYPVFTLEFDNINGAKNFYREQENLDSDPMLYADYVWTLTDENYENLKTAVENLFLKVNSFRNDGIGTLFDDSTQFQNTTRAKWESIISNRFVRSGYGFGSNGNILQNVSDNDGMKFINGFSHNLPALSGGNLECNFYSDIKSMAIPPLHFGKRFSGNDFKVMGLNPFFFFTWNTKINNAGVDYYFNDFGIMPNPYTFTGAQ